MEEKVFEMLTQYGVMGALLFIVLYWLVKHYLPEQERHCRSALERILACHDRNTNRLVCALERNTRVVQYNSHALLVQGFTKRGLSQAEAEGIVRRIQVAVTQGMATCAGGVGAAGGAGGAEDGGGKVKSKRRRSGAEQAA